MKCVTLFLQLNALKEVCYNLLLVFLFLIKAFVTLQNSVLSEVTAQMLDMSFIFVYVAWRWETILVFIPWVGLAGTAMTCSMACYIHPTYLIQYWPWAMLPKAVILLMFIRQLELGSHYLHGECPWKNMKCWRKVVWIDNDNK